MKFKQPETRAATFNLASMIDVVFLLLIFFIVTWTFARDEVDLEVQTPATSEGKTNKRPLGEKIINVRTDGSLRIDGEEVSQDELFVRLQRVAAIHENQPIRLRGDADCTFQTMTDIVGICNKAGIWNITFAAQVQE